MRRRSRYWSTPRIADHAQPDRLGNLVLIPASELASMAIWHERAQAMSEGGVMLVLPENHAPLREVGNRICFSLKQRGRRATITLLRA